VTTSACSAGGGGGAGTDTAAPSTPSGLTVTSTARNSVGVRWSPSTDNVGVTGYRLYRGSTRVATTTGTTFAFSGLACGTSYQLGVEAVDAAGNASGRRTVTVSTRSCGFSGWGLGS
jgi:chitodextrinase